MAHEQLTGAGNPWHSPAHATDWIARMDREAPDRREELELLLALLPITADAPARFLELGAGHGVLTRLILERFPGATLLALDLSPIMVAEGRRRLAVFGDRVRFLEWDLEQTEWPAEATGPFDAVVSSLAIHHLSARRKRELADQLHASLVAGGVFLNLDYVRPASEGLRERYARAGGGDDRAGHRGNLAGGHATGTLFEQLEDLRAAGFADVEVFWKRLSVALFGATRPQR